jgi:hypothetical protein
LISFESAAAATMPLAIFSGLSAKILNDFYPYSLTSMIDAILPMRYT